MHYRLADGETTLQHDIFDLLRQDLAGCLKSLPTRKRFAYICQGS